jgi:hypothetical protein
MNDAEALQFAHSWIEAWNSHNLDAIVALYAESVELVSPVAREILGDPHVHGKNALREYFAKGLQKFPDLRFDFLNAYRCESSVTLVYHGARGSVVAEVMFLTADNKIEKVYPHYVCATPDKNAS